MATRSPFTCTSSSPMFARFTPASTSPTATSKTRSPEKMRSNLVPPLSLVIKTDSVQRTVASWLRSRIPSTTTGPVVVRAGCSSKRDGPTTGRRAIKSKLLIPIPKATLKATIKSAMTSVDLNPPPFLPTVLLPKRRPLASILHRDPGVRRTPACTMAGVKGNGEEGSGGAAGDGRGGAIPLRGERNRGPGLPRLHGDHAERAAARGSVGGGGLYGHGAEAQRARNEHGGPRPEHGPRLDLLDRRRSYLAGATHERRVLHRALDGRHVLAVLRRQAPGAHSRHRPHQRLCVSGRSGARPARLRSRRPRDRAGRRLGHKGRGRGGARLPRGPHATGQGVHGDHARHRRPPADRHGAGPDPAIHRGPCRPPRERPAHSGEAGQQGQRTGLARELLPRRHAGQRRGSHNRAYGPLYPRARGLNEGTTAL